MPLNANNRGKTNFSLAGIIFDASMFEVPQDLEVGLETWGSIHKIPQTGTAAPKLISQTFGVFPIPIQWEARFLGAEAEARSRRLASAQQNQRVVPLLLGSRAWDCVIWKYTETIRSRFDIGYKIEVRPLRERSGRTQGSTTSLDASTQLKTQYNTINQLQQDPNASDPRSLAALSGGQPSLFQQISNILAAIQSIQPEGLASVGAILGVIAQINTAVSSFLGVLQTVAGSTFANDWTYYLWLAAQLSALNAYLSTLQTYTGQDAFIQYQMRAGDDLFMVAATQYGDWTRAIDIMNANGLSDVFAAVPMRINLPRS